MSTHVVATAGHVDHGKSTLVRALTGMEPDRWAEERRRGLTIDLGYAWTTLDSGRDVAFVDVPGHERFLGNMLAGLGPAPVVCFVVAADEGWRPQSGDHRDAVAALGIAHGVLVLARADRAPGRVAAVLAQARAQLAGTGLRDAPAVAVSATEGTGLDELRAVLDDVLAGTPAPAPGRLRLWADRSFPITGAGTVVTGTLAAGTLARGDRLELLGAGGPRPVTVRGLHNRNTPCTSLGPVDRVALNLRGVAADEIRRGDALVVPGTWRVTDALDVRRTAGSAFPDAPEHLVVHAGTAAVPARLSPFDDDHARLVLDRALPLVPGDRLVLRDPGARSVLGGAQVLDADPPALARRGDRARRAERLAGTGAGGDLLGEVSRRGAVQVSHLRRLGLLPDGPGAPGNAPGSGPSGPPGASGASGDTAGSGRPRTPGAAGGSEAPEDVRVLGEWWVHVPVLESWQHRLRTTVEQLHERDPLAAGLSRGAAGDLLGLPDPGLLDAVARGAGLEQDGGHLRVPGRRGLGAVEAPVAELERRLAAAPFRAPEAEDLAALRLGPRELAAAERAGRLLRLADGVVLLPGAPALAMRELARLAQPFTTSQARQALGTTRRVAVPLLEHLDTRGWTRRLDAGHRTVVR